MHICSWQELSFMLGDPERLETLYRLGLVQRKLEDRPFLQ
jgi:hypothetical protein